MKEHTRTFVPDFRNMKRPLVSRAIEGAGYEIRKNNSGPSDYLIYDGNKYLGELYSNGVVSIRVDLRGGHKLAKLVSEITL